MIPVVFLLIFWEEICLFPRISSIIKKSFYNSFSNWGGSTLLHWEKEKLVHELLNLFFYKDSTKPLNRWLYFLKSYLFPRIRLSNENLFLFIFEIEGVLCSTVSRKIHLMALKYVLLRFPIFNKIFLQV